MIFAITAYGSLPIYEDAARMLGATCKEAGIEYWFQKWPHTEDKIEIWNQRHQVVRNALDKYGCPIWYVDVDALLIDSQRLKEDTDKLIADRIDFACHMFECPPRRLHRLYGNRMHWPAGGALFFNNTAKVRELLKKWHVMHAVFPTEDDQMTIEHALKATVGLTTRTMPAEYYQMFDDKRYSELTPVFKQMQVRRNPGYLKEIDDGSN